MTDILLCTLNARFIHSSLGLRYLKANLNELESQAEIVEFTIDSRPSDILEELLLKQPKIIGLGVYIWNTVETHQLLAQLKQVAPDVIVVLGGPEVSYEHDKQEITQLADYIICGAGEHSFRELCQQILKQQAPTEKVIFSPPAALQTLKLPYDLYNAQDIQHRLIYVEASRGCPFKCEFCLSSLDKTAKPFELKCFLAEMAKLYQRGVRHFKFIDRTFNLKIAQSLAILDFFLEQCPDSFLHFELIPDHLPEELKDRIARFPAGFLQFEIGIQTFNPEVQQFISRRQDTPKTLANLSWLREHSQAHLHTDLIVGLPGENVESFAKGFDLLVSLNPHEIQVGILKRLRGTPIIRHTDPFSMIYNPLPPYNILSNNELDFLMLQKMGRFARFWDMIGNSGRFSESRSLILGDEPFKRFFALSEWLFEQLGATHRVALDRLFNHVYRGTIELLGVAESIAQASFTLDFERSKLKGRLMLNNANSDKAKQNSTTQRQQRHIG